MSSAAPTPLLVRPSHGVLMHSLIQSNPAVPAAYEPDLPDVFRQTLRLCRELEHAVTVAELAARMERSPAVVGVAITELNSLDLVRVVRAPAWAERLRAWATLAQPIPVVASVIKVLVVGVRSEHTHQALAGLAGNGPWCLQEGPRIEITTTRVAEDLEMLALGVTALSGTSRASADVCREAFGAVVVTSPETRDLGAAHESLVVLHDANVHAVVLVHETAEREVDTDAVRARLSLSADTPLVVGDLHGRGARDAIMDLCSVLMGGGRR